MTSTPIQSPCPSCGKILRIDSDQTGKKLRCSKCGAVLYYEAYSEELQLASEVGQLATAAEKSDLILALGLGIVCILAGIGITFFTPVGWIGGVVVGAFGTVLVAYYLYVILSPTAQNREIEGFVVSLRDSPDRIRTRDIF